MGPDARAADIRALTPPPRDMEGPVREIVDSVRTGGDAALRRLTLRFDGADVPPERLRVTSSELEQAAAGLPSELATGLRTALANVSAVARAQIGGDMAVELPEGQRVQLAELPVGRAAAYVPGGRAPYASTVVMCAAAAREAGVGELALCAPPGADGESHAVVLAACHLCGVAEVYRMGGAQAIAALAYGTESVEPVDVIVGPGNAFVQEAKRQVFGQVGIDSVAGPSELVVVASAGADPELAALDLAAQGEHGPDSLLVLIATQEELAREAVHALEGYSASQARVAVVVARNAAGAVELADALAPEHLQLLGAEAEDYAPRVRRAGCVFVGAPAGTAFGDYVAGSNHVLPTGGAARFAGALSPATFRRRMARVSLPAGAAGRLAPAGAALAAAEGFPLHGESMTRRA